MTLPQLKGFLAAIGRGKAVYNITFLSNVALGAQGKGKDIKKSLESYSKALEPIPDRPKRTPESSSKDEPIKLTSRAGSG